MKKTIDPKEFDVSASRAIGADWCLITAGKGGKSNTMTAGWGGMGVMWSKNVVFVVIRPTRYTKEFVDAAGRFSVCFPSGDYRKQLGYLGSVSGRDEDKISKSGMTLTEIDGVPCFEESRYTFVCKTLYAQEMKEACFVDPALAAQWFPEKDYHTMYIAEVEKLLVEE